MITGNEHDSRIAGGRCAAAFKKELAPLPNVDLSGEVELRSRCSSKRHARFLPYGNECGNG
jgi:hypothetical protein